MRSHRDLGAMMIRRALTLLAVPTLVIAQSTTSAPPPAAQNPSPMVENTRAHERLVERKPDGVTRSFAGPAGKSVELFIPSRARGKADLDLLIHFHGAAWVPDQAASAIVVPTVVATLNIGSGSGVYDRAFADPAVFDSLLTAITREVAAANGAAPRLAHVTLAGFSAGHGAVRAILRTPRHVARVDAVLLIDGMHTSYIPEGTALANGGTIDSTNLTAFAAFARAAMRGEKRFLVTHSEIFPGTFASTTETADWLLNALALRRTPTLEWGPRGTQQLSRVRAGNFELLGYAGNSAPDHIDQLHAMPELLNRVLSLHTSVAQGPRSGNPILPGWYADPEAHLFNGEYWIFPTYSAPYEQQTFLDAFSSRDLITWVKHPHVLDTVTVSWAKKAVWAPSIIKKGDWYYLFFGANDIQSDKEKGGIGVARSRSPNGPFKDLLGKPLIDAFHNGAQPIDQNVFQDVDGSYYIVYGGWRHCNIAKLNDDFTAIVPFPDGTLYKEITPTGYVEGAYMLVKDGKYYFMWSEGGWTGPNYAVAYAVGNSPFGPFERVGKILEQDAAVATGAGHHSVLHVPGTPNWYIVYHRRPLGETDRNHRVVSIDELHFDARGFIEPVRITKDGVSADAVPTAPPPRSPAPPRPPQRPR